MDVVVGVASLVVSSVALLVAFLAFRHERTLASTHGMLATVMEERGQRVVEGGRAHGIVGWRVSIEIIGPAPVLQAQPLWFVDGGEGLVEATADCDLVAVWAPGDAALEICITRTDVNVLPDEIWVGVTWAEPIAYAPGLLSQLRRWQVHPGPQGGGSTASQVWSHRGTGRWVKPRRPLWRPEPTNRWADDMKKPPAREDVAPPDQEP